MTKIAFELDMSDGMAEAAELNPMDYPPGYQPWMVGIVSPALFGKGKLLVSDKELMKPVEVNWYAANNSWGPGLEGSDDCS
jgi:hypothetical protein